jgi:DNA-binding response OmpR family regulator
VLVADDDPSILLLVTRILTRAQYRVDTAVNGRDALEKLAETHYDVVVLDLMMPEVSGLQVINEVAARPRAPRFIVIMSAGSPSLLEQASAPNVFATLRKPFEIEELVAAVDACVTITREAP